DGAVRQALFAGAVQRASFAGAVCAVDLLTGLYAKPLRPRTVGGDLVTVAGEPSLPWKPPDARRSIRHAPTYAFRRIAAGASCESRSPAGRRARPGDSSRPGRSGP